MLSCGRSAIKSVKAAFASIRACAASASLLWITPGGTTIPEGNP